MQPPGQSPSLELIRRSPFFAAAGQSVIRDLIPRSAVHRLPRGAVLFEQNDEPTHLHLLLSGRIGLRATGAGDEQTIVEIFGPGEVFLAPAVILRLPYLASAVALTEVQIMLIPAELFHEVLARDPALMNAVIQLLSRHWRLLVEQITDLKLRSAEERVARFLARRVSAEADAGPAELPESRIALAARLGMTPETLSRTLAALEAKGVIRMDQRHADVLDRAALLEAPQGRPTRQRS